MPCLIRSPGNEQSWHWFHSWLICENPISSHFALLLVSLASPHFCTPRLSCSFSKLKGTSKCLGGLDKLSQHQTLWSVWGCFCQGQSALEVQNSCITVSFSPCHLWAGALPMRITSGGMYHLQIQRKRKHNKDISICRNKKRSAQHRELVKQLRESNRKLLCGGNKGLR